MAKASYFASRRRDIESVLRRDPAARSALEVVLCYPGYKAVRRHRRAHWLWTHNFKLLARLVSQRTVRKTGIEIHPGAVIGDGCIINTCASVDHDCVLEDFVHIAVGAHVAGTVSIGAGTWIGAGATVSNNLQICGGCMIGAGAVVIKSITESGTYVGVPAEKIK